MKHIWKELDYLIMLTTMKELVDNARKGGYAVTAPNVWDEYSIKAALEAAEEVNVPVILDYADSFSDDIQRIGEIAVMLARKARVPVAISLDHGDSYEACLRAMRAGFTGVMIDRSTLPYEENVKQVKAVVDVAHVMGVSVEAELGHVGQGSQYDIDRDAGLTNVEQAADFVAATGIDSLAVAVGTAHGMYKGTPHLDFERLDQLREAVCVPLVLHGGSGTGDEKLQEAVRRGICKVNLCTDLILASQAGFNACMSDPKMGYIFFALQASAKTYREKLAHYMRLFSVKEAL